MPPYSNNETSCWRKRTRMERILLLLGICSTILIIALIVSLCVLHKAEDAQKGLFLAEDTTPGCEHAGEENQTRICMTPGCISAASKILQNMDATVDPCEDFYRFSCGSFLRNTNIRDDETSVDLFSSAHDNLLYQLRAILEEPIKSDEIQPFKMAKIQYKSCMSKSLTQSRWTQPLLKALNSFGGWPVLVGPNWNDSTFSWQKSFKDFKRKKYDITYFFDFNVTKDVIDSFKKIFIISAPNEQLVNLSTLNNPHTIAELQTEYPSISWLEYINDLLPAGLRVTRDEVVIIVSPTYLKDLKNLLKNTPKRVLANYVMWRINLWSVPFLPEEFRKRQFKYDSDMYETEETKPTWKECVEKVYEDFRVAVGSLYVQKYFNEDTKKLAVEMANGIRAEFINILENVDWMDEDTRKHALEKARAMIIYIAYPDEILDHNKLEEYYNDLQGYEDRLFESVLNSIIFKIKLNDTDWVYHANPADINAYHQPLHNSIDIPAGILQEVFFSADRPNYMNYGAIGYIIGHEISHGFDETGRQFDKDGILENWWSEATKDAYAEKANCIVQQYGNYTAKEINQNLNGISTQDENIADNGGFKLAYLAYSKWVEDNEEEPQLPGLKYTPKQMFWISAGNTWCSKYKPEALEDDILTDDHSPAEFRVLGPLSNLEEFARDFECPAGSPMNPHHKCKIW